MHTQTIKIQGKSYICPSPYVAGHQLTSHESDALNRVFAENCRNNFASRMRTASESENVLTQEDFDAYAETYVFGSRPKNGGRPVTRDPVATEEMKLAKGVINAQLAARGFKPKDLDDATREAYYNAAVATGKFREAATVNVANKAALKDAMSDLGDFGDLADVDIEDQPIDYSDAADDEVIAISASKHGKKKGK